MSKLPLISGRECVSAFQRQTGSHIILQRDNPKAILSIPNHKELGPGILRALIRQAGLTVEEFMQLLD